MFWEGKPLRICWLKGKGGWMYWGIGGRVVGFYVPFEKRGDLWVGGEGSWSWWGSWLGPYRECGILKDFSRDVNYKSCKVTFKRKGSWLHFRRLWPRFISLKFGHGHAVLIPFSDGIYCRRKKYLQRHSLLLMGGSWGEVLGYGINIRNWRYFGRYTKRGVRLAREFFYRQQGKESQYTHLKSKIF